MKQLQIRLKTFVLAFGPALLLVEPTFARGGCTAGSGTCLQLSGDHPAAPFIGWLMAIAVGAMLLGVIGVWAMHLKRQSEVKTPMTIWTVLTLFGQPGWPLEKKLALGGLVTSISSLVLGYVLLQVFGTRV